MSQALGPSRGALRSRRAEGAGFVARGTWLPGSLAVEACSGHRFPRHAHDAFGIGLLTSGAQVSWSGRGQVEARAGDVITVNPGEVHDGAPIGERRTWSMLYFSPETLCVLVEDLRTDLRTDSEFLAPVLAHPRLAGLVAALYRAAIDPDSSSDHQQARLLPVLAALLAVREPGPAPLPARLARVRQLLDDMPLSTHSLESLSREAGLSRYQTLRGFQRSTGLTPHAYLTLRRLEHARAAVRAGVPLAEAAVAAGFSDQSHFHRAFVRQFGFTPGAFARALAVRSCKIVQDPRPLPPTC